MRGKDQEDHEANSEGMTAPATGGDAAPSPPPIVNARNGGLVERPGVDKSGTDALEPTVVTDATTILRTSGFGQAANSSVFSARMIQ